MIYEHAPDAPYIINNNNTGTRFWGIIFTYCILFPMSVPRNASALRFTSLFGVLCSMFLCFAVILVFFTDKTMVPSPSDNLSQIEPFHLTYKGVVSTMPLIIFAYMYQVNIPMIYVELETRTSKAMSTVVGWGSTVAVSFYVMVGIFGYAIFVENKIDLCAKNIL